MTNWIAYLLVWVYSQAHPNDDNLMSILAYAVDYLKVTHGWFTLVSRT